jgi:protein tyrosine phosphatase (PTP) superfamily phosphohydrolase (DUF442 family)
MASDVDTTRGRRGWRQFAFMLALLVVIGGATWAWSQYFQTYHYAVVQDGVLLRDGNRGVREFETALRKGHVKTVVSLIDDQELADPRKPQFAKEMDLCKEQGVRMVRIPVKLGGWPTTADVQKFLEIASAKENQPVLVHCAQGVRRTGMMVAAFQESVLGLDDKSAKAAKMTFGHSERTVKDVERFIDVYDAKEKRVTKQLEQSNEE